MRAVVSRYSKLTPVECAALLMAPVICDARLLAMESTDMKVVPNSALAGPRGFVLIDAAQARRALFRGFRGRPNLRASLHPYGDADGQHVVLQHDAQSAAAAHRPPL